MTNAIKNELNARTQIDQIKTPGRGMSAYQIGFCVLGFFTVLAVIVG